MVSALHWKIRSTRPEEIPTLRAISIDEFIIESKPVVKHLGVTVDQKLSFFKQNKAAADKAATGVSAFGCQLVNIGGPTSSRRCLQMSAT